MDFDSQKVRRLAIAIAVALAAASVVVPSGLTRARQHLIYDLIAFLAGGGLIVFGFIVLRRKRLLENVPTSRIRSVAMGFAELRSEEHTSELQSQSHISYAVFCL